MPDESPIFPEQLLAPTAAVLRAQISVDAAIQAKATKPAGLDPAVADLLVRLSTSDGNSLRGVEIGRQLMIGPTKVSRLVDRAEAVGLVERVPHPTDRRAQNVTLTEEGRRRSRVFAPLLVETLERISAPLTRSEMAELVRLLEILSESAQAVAASATEQDHGR